jgi:hypothetical protein
MTSPTKAVEALSLPEQIDAIRLQMQQQRQLISQQLIQATDANQAYPRSMTMRFLTQQSGVKILAEVSTFVFGARLLKLITKSVRFARSVYF